MQSCRRFFGFLVLNQKFFLGEIPETPYHCGPIDDETIPSSRVFLDSMTSNCLLIIVNRMNTSVLSGQAIIGLNMNSDHMYPLPCLRYIVATENSLLCLGIDQRFWCRPLRFIHELIPSSDKQVVVSRDRIAKSTKDLRSTAWEPITMALTDVDISGEEFFCLDSLKRSEPVVFVVAAREWGVRLDLLGVIEDAAIDCHMPRMSRLRKHMANVKQ